MPLEVYLEDAMMDGDMCVCRDCGNQHKSKGKKVLYATVIAHSYAAMASHCGLFFCIWYPEKLGVHVVSDLVPYLHLALVELRSNPEEYKCYVLRDHFNYVSDLITFAEDLLAACQEFPNATVRVDT